MSDSSAPLQGLERTITLGGISFTAFNSIVGAGIFALPGLVAAVLGPAAILAYLVCMVLIGLIALCLAEVGSRVSDAGGLYAYVEVAFGPVAGGVAGILLLVASSVVPSAALSRFLLSTLAVVWPVLDTPGPRTLALALIYAGVALVNIGGTRGGAGLSAVMAALKLTPLLLLLVVGAFAIHPANLHWTSVPGLDRIGKGAMLLFFAFMGIEGGLNTSGEVIDPARTIPRAILLTLGGVAVLYLGLQMVTLGVLGPQLALAKAPLVATAQAVLGPCGSALVLGTTALSLAGYLAADMLASPRLAYALAEKGHIPPRLARVHRRHGTPAWAIGSYALACFALSVTGSFRALTLMGTSGTLLLYAACCLALLPLRRRGVEMSGKPFIAPGGVFVPLAAVALVGWLLSTLSGREIAPTLALVAVAGGFYGLRGRRAAPVPLR